MYHVDIGMIGHWDGVYHGLGMDGVHWQWWISVGFRLLNGRTMGLFVSRD